MKTKKELLEELECWKHGYAVCNERLDNQYMNYHRLITAEREKAKVEVATEIMETFNFIDDYETNINKIKKDKLLFGMEKELLSPFYKETIFRIKELRKKYPKGDRKSGS